MLGQRGISRENDDAEDNNIQSDYKALGNKTMYLYPDTVTLNMYLNIQRLCGRYLANIQ